MRLPTAVGMIAWNIATTASIIDWSGATTGGMIMGLLAATTGAFIADWLRSIIEAMTSWRGVTMVNIMIVAGGVETQAR